MTPNCNEANDGRIDNFRGRLSVYRVKYFHPATLEIVVWLNTLNKEAAEKELDRLHKMKFSAGIESFQVDLDGAFPNRSLSA